jgi:hypothetical protein
MAEQDLGIVNGLAGMLNAFVDPIGLAKRVRARLFWLWPLITICIIYVVFGYLMLPYTLQVVDFQMLQRASAQNLTPERIEAARNLAHTISQAGIAFTPVFVVGILALLAWLVSVTGSVVGVRVKFRDVFSLMAACGLITSLQVIATYIVIRVKGEELQSPEQLMAPFGGDIFIQEVHGAMLALLNFFSIFEIWYIVILWLSVAYLTGVSKGKAFAAITPAWLVPLLLALVRARFSPGASG